MSGIDTVYTLVQDQIKRADKQAQIWRRIHRSILKHHRIDQWKKDLVEQIYTFDVVNTVAANIPIAAGANALFMNSFYGSNNALNIQVIDTTQLIRFRMINYLRKWMTVDQYGVAILDPFTGQQGTTQGGELREKNADSLSDSYGFNIENVYYLSGTDIKINSSTPLNQVYFGYFKDPKVTLDCNSLLAFQTYESFIVDDYPGVIVADVCKYMFGQIGKLEAELKLAQEEYQNEIATLQANCVRCSTRQ